MPAFRLAAAALTFVAWLGFLPHTFAQAFPNKPIRVIVSFPPGSSLDLSARAIGQKVSENIGQQVLVDNRAGGNTIVSADVAAHSAPDGYTLFQALDTTLTLIPSLYAKVPYDPVRDFAPITQISSTSYLYVAPAKASYRTLADMVGYVKANPGKLNIGASTVLTQVFVMTLKSAAAADVIYVPYKGTPPMLQALMAGEIDLAIDAIPVYLAGIKAGKLVPLATSGASRAVQLPDVPTVREAGFPQLEANSWTALFAPAGTPEPVLAKLYNEYAKVLNDPAFRQRMLDAGQYPITASTPEQLGAMVKEGLARWTPIVKSAGIKLD